MTWFIDGVTSILSAIIVFFLGVLVGWFRRFKEIGIKNYRDGFTIPNTHTYFRHGRLDDNRVPLTVRKIMSIKCLKTKELSIGYPVFTTGKIDESVSLSDPGRMELTKPNEIEGRNSLNITGKRNTQYLIVVESKRTVFPNIMCNHPDDKVLASLIKKRIKTENHDFCGTRIIARTSSLRIIVEFSNSFKPDFVHPIQINEHGEIIRDEKSTDFVTAVRKDGTLFILDLHQPELNSGVYVWWEWPNLN